MKLISPLPGCKLNSVHHSLKYDREQSCADKSFADSNHTSSNKYHRVCHHNPTNVTRQTAAKMKKRRRSVVKSVSVLPAKSKSKLHSQQQVYHILRVQKTYSVQMKKKKQLLDMLDEIPEAKTIISNFLPSGILEMNL